MTAGADPIGAAAQAPTYAHPPRDPRPEEVRRILDRIGLRWGQLTVDQASARRTAMDECADFCLSLIVQQPHRDRALPDLGPTTALDQLRVTVFDACAEDHCPQLPGTLTDLLARLR